MKIGKKYRKIHLDFNNVPGKRTSISERPTIPPAKIFKSAKDRSTSRQARKESIRNAKNEY